MAPRLRGKFCCASIFSGSLLTLCCLLPAITRADSLVVSTATGENDFSVTNCLNTSKNTPTATVSCGATTATASLTNGTAGVLAQVVAALPNMPNQTDWIATAKAGLTYSDTVDVPSGTGMAPLSSGTAVFTLSVSGTVNITNPAGCSECFGALAIPSSEGFVGSSGTVLYLAPGQSTVQISTPVSGGSADFAFVLAASAVCPPATPFGFSCTATVNYLDPLAITHAAVYDANGNLVPGATITSASGFSPPTGAPTPEPSSFFLFASGLLALGGVLRRNLKV